MRMLFGKHCGAKIEDLPNVYLRGLYEDLHIRNEQLWQETYDEYARRWGRKKAERFRPQHGTSSASMDGANNRASNTNRASGGNRTTTLSRSGSGQAQEIADSHPQLFAEMIEAGYRTLAKRYHPDVNAGDAAAAEKMRLLNRIMAMLRGLNQPALPRPAAKDMAVADPELTREQKVGHPNLKPAERCPQCQKGKLYPVGKSKCLVGIVGRPPLEATVYKFGELRCNLCGEVFTPPAPANLGMEKYDVTAVSMIALLSTVREFLLTVWRAWSTISAFL